MVYSCWTCTVHHSLESTNSLQSLLLDNGLPVFNAMFLDGVFTGFCGNLNSELCHPLMAAFKVQLNPSCFIYQAAYVAVELTLHSYAINIKLEKALGTFYIRFDHDLANFHDLKVQLVEFLTTIHSF